MRCSLKTNFSYLQKKSIIIYQQSFACLRVFKVLSWPEWLFKVYMCAWKLYYILQVSLKKRIVKWRKNQGRDQFQYLSAQASSLPSLGVQHGPVTGRGTRARDRGSVGEGEAGRNSLRLEHNAFELDLKSLVPWWYLTLSSVSQKDINPGDKTQCSPCHRPTYLDWGGSAACHPADIHLRLYWILFFSDKSLFYISNFSEDIDLIIIVKDQKR